MESKYTPIYYISAIAMAVLAVLFFLIASGTFSLAIYPKEEGAAMDLTPVWALLIPLAVLLLSVNGILTVFIDEEFPVWLTRSGVALAFLALALITGLYPFFCITSAAVAAGWWFFISLKNLSDVAGYFEESSGYIMYACRIIIFAALAAIAVTWAFFPLAYKSDNLLSNAGVIVGYVAGGLCAAGAVAFVAEAVIWNNEY